MWSPLKAAPDWKVWVLSDYNNQVQGTQLIRKICKENRSIVIGKCLYFLSQFFSQPVSSIILSTGKIIDPICQLKCLPKRLRASLQTSIELGSTFSISICLNFIALLQNEPEICWKSISAKSDSVVSSLSLKCFDCIGFRYWPSKARTRLFSPFLWLKNGYCKVHQELAGNLFKRKTN